MRKNLSLILLTMFLMFVYACSDDSRGVDEPLQEDKQKTSTLTCLSPENCVLELKPNTHGVVSVTYKEEAQPLSDVTLKFDLKGEAFKLNATEATTDSLGIASITVYASELLGDAQIIVSAVAKQAQPLAITLRVSEEDKPSGCKSDDECPTDKPICKDGVCHAKDIEKLTLSIEYTNSKALEISKLETRLFGVDGCARILPPEPVTPKKLSDILSSIQNIEELNIADASKLPTISIVPVTNLDSYTVVGLVKNAEGIYTGYGCVDGLKKGNENGKIDLLGIAPMSYAGTYVLHSSFDMTSALPKAQLEGDTKPTFSQMLLGDWVDFVLSLFAEPENVLVDVVSTELVGVVGKWAQQLVGISPELLDTILKAFKPQIVTLLKNYTGKLKWWEPMTKIAGDVEHFAHHFEIDGQIVIVSEPSKEGLFENKQQHNYSNILYKINSIGGDKCINGKPKDAEGYCSLPLGEAMSGLWAGKLKDCEKGKCLDINEHGMKFAYATILYNFVTKVALPLAFPNLKDANGNKLVVDSIASLVEHVMLKAIVQAYNKSKPEAEQVAITGKGCTDFGTMMMKFVNKIEGVNKIVTPASLAMLCTMGISQIDPAIKKLLEKFAIDGGDVLLLSSNGCHLTYNESRMICSEIGNQKLRCVWDLRLQTGKDSTNKPKYTSFKGKYFAIRTLK